MKEDPDLPALLRKCIALGGQSGSAALREWAVRELKGYQGEKGDVLPPYRIVTAALLVDGMTMTHRIERQQISPAILPPEARGRIKEEFEFWGPIAELSDMVKRATAKGETAIRLGMPGGSALAALMTAHMQQSGQGRMVERIYHEVAVTSIIGVLDAVQTNLVELIAEIRAGLPAPGAVPDKETADRALGVVIYGNRNRVQVRSAVATGSSAAMLPASEPRKESWLRRWMWWAVGLATIAGSAIALLAWHPWEH